MYREGNTFRAISRILEAPLLTVFTWVKKVRQALALRVLVRRQRGRTPPAVIFCDEMWTGLMWAGGGKAKGGNAGCGLR